MKLLYFFLIVVLANDTNCAKILGIFSSACNSHVILGQALFKILAKYGHQVTLVSPFPMKKVPANYSQIVMQDLREGMVERLPSVNNNNFLDEFGTNVFRFLYTVYQMGDLTTKKAFEDPVVQKLLKSKKKFDIVISEIFINEALMACAQHFDAIPIAFTTLGPSERNNDLVGNPSPYSYAPHVYLGFTDRMSFFERVTNMFVTIYGDLLINYYHLPKQEKHRRKFLPHTDPLPKILKNVSLVFLNSHTSLTYPRPLVPNMIEIGGFHVSDPKPLPHDLERILNGSKKNGAIFFSMGSTLRSIQLPTEIRNEILSAFGKLKQTVLFKWEETELPNRPKNVVIRSWFPQSDILAHPSVKLFITHGGLLSTTEAVVRGVPLIGFPAFADQRFNMRRAQTFGYAKVLEIRDITSESLSQAINDVLNNPEYAENIKKHSFILNDRRLKVGDEINYWIEYVLRHKGAFHLRTARNDLKLYQYLLLDIIGFILLIFILAITVIYICIKLVMKTFLTRRKSKKNKKKIN